MKPLTSGKLKTTGTSFLLQCSQNTSQPFCCLSLVCHLLLSPLHGTSASQSSLNYFVFPRSPPPVMSSITDVSSALFHVAFHPWETWSNGLNQGTGKGVTSQEGPWLLLDENVRECRLRLGGWSPAPDPCLQYQSAQVMSASLSTDFLWVEGKKFLLWSWACESSTFS